MTQTLYVISCAAPPARRITTGIKAAQARGWDVALVLTPAAHRWSIEEADGDSELDAWRQLTGHRYATPTNCPPRATSCPTPPHSSLPPQR